MDKVYDLIIIGSGPAGVAAAVTASSLGVNTLVVDEQSEPGGQIYRAIERSRPENSHVLGKDYFAGKPLIEAFRASGVAYMPSTTVLNITDDLHVDLLSDGVIKQVCGRRILLAIGAVERPVPMKNWTLPGVMGAAAADIVFKSANMVPDQPVVLAGSGPLLLLVACHLVDNGVRVAAMVETAGIKEDLNAVAFLPRALLRPGYLFKGLQMRLKLKRAGIPLYMGCRDLEVIGHERAEGLRFTHNGKPIDFAAKSVLLHEGVTPNLRLSQALNCEHEWYEPQRYWKPVLDEWGQTSEKNISIAGDCSGIGGGAMAAAKGHLAALDCAYKLKRISRSERGERAVKYKKSLSNEALIRPFIDHIFPPNHQTLNPAKQQTIVCRCEEITVGQIHEAISQGARHPAQIKGKTRAGMGPCQGRMCASTIAEIIAERCSLNIAEVEAMRIRTPLKPLSIEQYANLAITDKE